MFVSSSNAQVIVQLDKLSKKPGFYVDLASFFDPVTKKTRLEIYYKIYNNELTFVKTQENYRASYEVRVVLLKGGRQVAGTSREEEYPVSDYSGTISAKDFIINQLTLETEAGKYQGQVTLIDKQVEKGYALDVPLVIPDYPKDQIGLSDIEMAQAVSDTQPGSQFNKPNFQVIPKVRQSFEQTSDSLICYYEIYANKSQPIRAEYVVQDYLDKTVLDKTDTIMVDSLLKPVVRSFDISDFPPGRYTLIVSALGGSKRPVAQAKQNFEVDWSIDYYVRHDFKKAIDLLRYAATGDEIKALKKTPPEKQAQAWRDFWKSKDPTPETPENEFQDEYYRRIRYANDNFSIWSKPGWKTDFGMVYIKYGEPDEIDRHPFDPDSRPFEVWYYYSLRRVFTFAEDHATGEYRLQYPYDGDVYRSLR